VIAGIDEVGRGPLAGPVVAAAVILDPARPVTGITDSKRLAPRRRELLAGQIRERALAWAVAECTPAEIDRLNILQASLLAMQRAVAALSPAPASVLVDGAHLPALPYPARAVIGGDASEPAIGAASIIAKVHRDALMLELHARHPEYAFDRHKGYPTPLHLERLRLHGPLPCHRRSFAPVRAVLASRVGHPLGE